MQPVFSSLPFLGLLLLSASSIAQELSRPFSIQDATDTIAIQQVINLYSIAADQKRFELLSQIFTADVTINFNSPGVPILHGLVSVTDFMSAALRDVVSYHAESTHSVDLSSPARCHATTYNSAKFFGAGQQQGQTVSKWGRYEDDMVRTSRGWRISSRTLVNVGSSGDPSIVLPGHDPNTLI